MFGIGVELLAMAPICRLSGSGEVGALGVSTTPVVPKYRELGPRSSFCNYSSRPDLAFATDGSFWFCKHLRDGSSSKRFVCYRATNLIVDRDDSVGRMFKFGKIVVERSKPETWVTSNTLGRSCFHSKSSPKAVA